MTTGAGSTRLAAFLGGVFEQIDRQRDRALEESELDEPVEAGERVDVLVGASLDDAERHERERIEGDPGALERAAERERLVRERMLRRRQRIPERDLALLALPQRRGRP